MCLPGIVCCPLSGATGESAGAGERAPFSTTAGHLASIPLHCPHPPEFPPRPPFLDAAHTSFSIPFFFGCDHDVVMDPIPTCVSEDRPNRYEVMTAGDYVHMRLSAVYANGMKKA